VPSNFVKDILTHLDPEGRSGKWIAFMLEYDLEIKTKNIIKGWWLEKLMVQSNCDVLGINFITDLSENTREETIPQVSQKFIDSPWYAHIIYVLRNLQAPLGLRKTKSKFLNLKVAKFCILDNSLYWKNLGGILLIVCWRKKWNGLSRSFKKETTGGIITGIPLRTKS
jgi:hypothetical protein